MVEEYPDVLVRYRDPRAKDIKWDNKNPDDLCRRYLPVLLLLLLLSLSLSVDIFSN